jgi:dihydrofolate reductase
MTAPRLTLIAAVARNGVIGQDNALPWRLPEDLKRFKALTMGHPIVMGRKTWESLGRPLPGRNNIVITRDKNYRAEGASVVHTIDEALVAAQDATEVFVIGGAEIYTITLPRADCLQLTELDADVDGDVRFPTFDRAQWRTSRGAALASGDGLGYCFVTYERLKES